MGNRVIAAVNKLTEAMKIADVVRIKKIGRKILQLIFERYTFIFKTKKVLPFSGRTFYM